MDKDPKNVEESINNINVSQATSKRKPFFLNYQVRECIKNRLCVRDVVKILCRERALKLVDLARKIGISRQGLNNYISGRWAVPTQIKIKIAEALGVDSSVIWDLEK